MLMVFVLANSLGTGGRGGVVERDGRGGRAHVFPGPIVTHGARNCGTSQARTRNGTKQVIRRTHLRLLMQAKMCPNRV